MVSGTWRLTAGGITNLSFGSFSSFDIKPRFQKDRERSALLAVFWLISSVPVLAAIRRRSSQDLASSYDELGKPNQIPTLGIRVQPDLQAIGFEQRNTLQCSIPATSPWLFSHPCVNFDLHCLYKDDTAPDIYRSMFYEICTSYDNFDYIYTDGSKICDRVASAAICSNMVRSTHYQTI